ncbi:hypothetical protein PENTCL1PPCAC_12515, partial [Pristionchus entomophagus]
QISLSKLPPPIGYDREIGGKKEDYFDILGLPTELISHTSSLLEMEDRLRARVNKRLNIIEFESKYHVESLLIEEAVEEEEEKEDE